MWLLRHHNIALSKRDISATVVLHKRQIGEHLNVEMGPKNIVLLYFYVFVKNDFVDFVTIASDFLGARRK